MAANFGRVEALASTSGRRMLRVVSLLPSAAEVICFVGAEKWLVGRGHEDDFPPSITDRPVLTSTRHHFTTSAEVDASVTEALANGEGLYSVNAELLRALQPDLIFTQALCSICAVDCALVWRITMDMVPRPVVVTMSPKCLADIISDIRTAGQALGLASEGEMVAESLERRIEAVKAQVQHSHWPLGRKPRVMFMEWVDPIFCGGHWTPSLIEMAGGVHPINPANDSSGLSGAGDSFRVSPERVLAMDPDWVIVSPCGLNIATTKRELQAVAQKDWWQRLRAVQGGQVVLVDGNQMFNRPGPRIVDALEWLVGLLNNKPEVIPASFPWEKWSDDQQDEQDGRGNADKTHQKSASKVSNLERSNIDNLKPTSSFPDTGGSSNAKSQGMGATGAITAVMTSVVGSATSDCQAQTREEEESTSDDYSDDDSPRLKVGQDANWVQGGRSRNARDHQSSPDGQTTMLKNGVRHTFIEGNTVNEGLCLDAWEAPQFPVDIEELHQFACRSHSACYKDPQTGYVVFTEIGLKSRGNCCGNKCRHCPYGHFAVPPWKGQRANVFKDPIFLVSSEAAVKLGLKNKKVEHQFKLLSWQGDISSLIALEAVESQDKDSASPLKKSPFALDAHNKDRQNGGSQKCGDSPVVPVVVLVVFYDAKTGKVVVPFFEEDGPAGQLLPISLRAVMDHGLYLGKPMLAIPLDPSCNSQAAAVTALKRGIAVIPGKVLDISFTGDGNQLEQVQNGLLLMHEHGKTKEVRQQQEENTVLATAFPLDRMRPDEYFNLFQVVVRKHQPQVLQILASEGSDSHAARVSRVSKLLSGKQLTTLREHDKAMLHGGRHFTFVQFQIKQHQEHLSRDILNN